MAKRRLFDEMMEGVAAMKSHREGKLSLRTYKVAEKPSPTIGPKPIRETREKLFCSRAVFARKLRVNERTLAKWEQGRAKPNAQAATRWFCWFASTRIRCSGWRNSGRTRRDHGQTLVRPLLLPEQGSSAARRNKSPSSGACRK
jgi:putative transcriptional regulator